MKNRIKKQVYSIYEKEIFKSIHGFPTKFKIIRLYPILKLRYHINRFRYGDAAPNPFEILWINPSNIERFSGKEWPPKTKRLSQLGSVKGGDWDIKSFEILEEKSTREAFNTIYKDKFQETGFFKSARQHFNEGKNWEETKYYRFLDSTDRVDWLDEFDNLNSKIKSEGYICQTNLSESKISKEYFDHPIVDISRNGEFLLRDGRHRPCIALILNIERIPVRVSCRHAKWQEKRNNALKKPRSLSEKYIEHPDIEKLIENN